MNSRLGYYFTVCLLLLTNDSTLTCLLLDKPQTASFPAPDPLHHIQPAVCLHSTPAQPAYFSSPSTATWGASSLCSFLHPCPPYHHRTHDRGMGGGGAPARPPRRPPLLPRPDRHRLRRWHRRDGGQGRAGHRREPHRRQGHERTPQGAHFLLRQGHREAARLLHQGHVSAN
jgi:hypothetical protein